MYGSSRGMAGSMPSNIYPSSNLILLLKHAYILDRVHKGKAFTFTVTAFGLLVTSI